MSLYTKCIFCPKESTDGIRLSVMSRHTLNDGRTIDPRITLELYDEWQTILAPSPKLVGAYYRKEVPWEVFEKKYLEYLRTVRLQGEVEIIARRAFETDITLLCVEETPQYCHRRLLAQECQWHLPALEVLHK